MNGAFEEIADDCLADVWCSSECGAFYFHIYLCHCPIVSKHFFSKYFLNDLENVKIRILLLVRLIYSILMNILNKNHKKKDYDNYEINT